MKYELLSILCREEIYVYFVLFEVFGLVEKLLISEQLWAC